MSKRTLAKARTREALLDAALTVLAQHGFHGSRLDVIANAAGYSTGAVYASFSSKDDLFIALADRELVQFLTVVQEHVGHAVGVEDAARSSMTALLTYLEQRPEFFVLLMELWTRSLHEPEFRELYRERRAVITMAFAVMLEEKAKSSDRQLIMPPAKFAILVEAFGEGIALRYLADPASVSQADIWMFAEIVAANMTRPR